MKKKIIWSIVLIILLVGIFICVKRWNVWFGNPAEPPYTSLSYPGRVQLTFGNEGESSRNISWQYGDKIYPSSVFFTRQGSNDTISVNGTARLFETLGGTTVIYRAILNQLEEGTYDYSIETDNKQTPWYSFEVRRNPKDFSFIYTGDIQDTLNGISPKLFSEIRRLHPKEDFWVLGGDIIDRPQDFFWNIYFSSMDSISQYYPVIGIPGNHEYIKGVLQTLDERFIHVYPYFIDSRQKKNTVYSTTYGNTAIITLDSNREYWHLSSQANWLEEKLKEAENFKWKIVVLHHPIYSIKGKFNNYPVKFAFEKLMKKYNVDLVLQGHEHAYARLANTDKDDVPTTPLYIIGVTAPKKLYKVKGKEYDKYGFGKHFYHIINVDNNSLSVLTYNDDHELFDNVHITKENNKAVVSFD